MVLRSLVIGIALAGLAGCDGQKPAETPAATAPVAVEPPPPPPPPKPLLAAEALAEVDQPILCGLFARAMSDATVKVPAEGCVITPGASDVTITTKNGAQSLVVPLVVPGMTVQITSANASPRAAADTVTGGFSNFGFMFIGRADAADLCLSVEYRAPDGASNSLFIGGDPAKKPVRFDVEVTKGKLATAAYPAPTVRAGKIRAFNIIRRENGTTLKSVTFRSCS